ncbi:MAG: LamG domain-containing protein [Candidatus Micrarchaeota archaeon]|nr:LamG domain-containing protein [Candidatus Micrarchaeota archaeon]
MTNKKFFVKAQAAFENMLLASLLLIPIVLIFAFTYANLVDSTNVSSIDTSLEALEFTINQVYGLPIGSQRYVYLVFPSGIDLNNSYIGSNSSLGSGKAIAISYKGSTAFRNFRFNITGKLPNSTGKYLFSVFKAENKVVKVYPTLGKTHGLVASYNFSNTTNDSTIYQNHAISVNNPNCSKENNGVINSYCSLNGSNYFIIPDKDNIRFSSSDFSILAVLRKTEGSSGFSNYYGIVKWKSDATISSSEYGIFLSSTGNDNSIVFRVASNSSSYNVSYPIALNEWYHIVAVKNSTHISLYINSLLVNSSFVGNINVNSLNNPITIGTNNLTNSFTKMDIDEILIYSRALDSFEIEENYLAKYI